MEHIPPESVIEAVKKNDLDYMEIRLICGTHTVFYDHCIYIGDLSDVPAEAYKDKRIGLITTNDADCAAMDADYIKLSDDVCLLALYEELRDLWNYNDIGQLVNILGRIFTSTSIDQIINQTAKVLNNPVVLFDYNSQLLAACCDQPIDDSDIRYLLDHGHMSTQFIKEARNANFHRVVLNSPAPVVFEAGGYMTHKRITGMIWSNQRSQAAISVLEYNRKLTIADSNILGGVCSALSHLIENKSEYGWQANIFGITYESRLLALMDQKDCDLSWVSGWLAFMHWEKYQNFHVVVVQDSEHSNKNAQNGKIIAKLRQRIRNSASFLYDQSIVMILNVKDRVSFHWCLEELEHVLSEFELCAGISKRFTEIREIRTCYRQSTDAIRLSKLLGFQQTVSIFDAFIPYDLLLAAQGQRDLKRYDDYRLEILADYDRRVGTDYYLTLQTYLQSGCSRTQAAKRLFINRNTMDYRMNKIREMLELDDFNGEEYLKLYLAFKARELEEASTVSEGSQKKD